MDGRWLIDDLMRLQRLEAMGMTFRINGDRLMIGPPKMMTRELTEWIKSRKPALLEVLPAREQWREIECTL